MLLFRAHGKSHRGMTFIELIASLVVVAISCTSILTAATYLVKSYTETMRYTAINNSTINAINLIKNDLENDVDISSQDYNSMMTTKNINISVQVRPLGVAFDSNTYLVKIRAKSADNAVTGNTSVILRKGVTLDAT